MDMKISLRIGEISCCFVVEEEPYHGHIEEIKIPDKEFNLLTGHANGFESETIEGLLGSLNRWIRDRVSAKIDEAQAIILAELKDASPEPTARLAERKEALRVIQSEIKAIEAELVEANVGNKGRLAVLDGLSNR